MEVSKPRRDDEQVQVPTFHGQLARYHFHQEKQPLSPRAAPLPRWLLHLGVGELFTGDVWRGNFIEFFGMLFLYPVHCNIVVHSVNTYGPEGGDVNLAIGIGHFFLMTFFILCFAAPSGGHLNPLISWATCLTFHTPFVSAGLYTAAQVFGAFLGAKAYDNFSPENIATAACSQGDLSAQQAFSAEFFFSMALLIVAYGIAFDARQRQLFGPIIAVGIIGAQIGLMIWASAGLAVGYTGAGVNPVMCWAANVVAGGEAARVPQWPYWVGPLVAAVAHAVVYLIAPPHHKSMYFEDTAQSKPPG